jgi:hypothetical protein
MNVSEMHRAFKLLAMSKKSGMVRANHGVGKSAVVKQFQEKMSAIDGEEWGFVDLRLSQQDVGDLRGIPFRINGSTFFAPPQWLPVHPDYQADLTKWLTQAGEAYSPFNTHKKGVLFLDEFNRATREVMQCAFELVLDRRLGGVPIPEGWLVVAAINHDQDIYQVQQIDPALTNRFETIDFLPSPEEWFNWAKPEVAAGRMHPAVLDYLRTHENKLIPKKEDILKSAEEGEPLFTPRSWSTLGDLLAKSMSIDEDLCEIKDGATENFLGELCKGSVGSTAAVGFIGWLKTEYKTLNAKMIIDSMHLEGDKTEAHLKKIVKGNRVQEMTALMNDTLNELKGRGAGYKLSDAQIGNLTTLVEIFPAEISMGFFTSLAKQDKKQTDTIYNWKEQRPGKKATNGGKAVEPFKVRIFGCCSRVEALKSTAAAT